MKSAENIKMNATIPRTKDNPSGGVPQYAVRVTNHGVKRAAKRVGVNKKAVLRLADKAYRNGYTPEQLKGELALWVYSNEEPDKSLNPELRLYGDKLYIFSDAALITVLPIPKALNGCREKFIIGKTCRNPACSRHSADSYQY